MEGLRGVSTVLGTIISLVAILSVLAAASYMLNAMSVSSANVAKLSSQRMNELLEMYTSLVINNTGSTVCFETPGDTHLVKSIILVEKGKVKTLRKKCVSSIDVEQAKEVIVASRSGALLKLDPRMVRRVKGAVSLQSLLGATEASEQGIASFTIAPEPVRRENYALDALNVTIHMRLRASDRPVRVIFTLDKGITEDVIIPLYSTVLYQGAAVNLKPYRYLAYFLISGYASETNKGSVPIPVKLLKLDNNTVCGFSGIGMRGITGSGGEYMAVLTCIKRKVLKGDIVVNSTLVWMGTPLSRELIPRLLRYHTVLLRIGPPGGIVSIISPLRRNIFNKIVIMKPFVTGTTINLAPLIYAPVGSYLGFVDGGYTTLVTGLQRTNMVANGLPRPYAWTVWTPIALYYNIIVDNTNAPPYLLLYYRDYREGVIYMATLYQPGFITYVEPAPGTTCRLEWLEAMPPIPADNGVQQVPGMVCVKIGEYNATLIPAEADSKREVIDVLLKLKLPGDIVACYYPARLVCRGIVYQYYSFAPSTLYEQQYVIRTVNKLYDYLLRLSMSKDIAKDIVYSSLLHTHAFGGLSKAAGLDGCNVTSLVRKIMEEGVSRICGLAAVGVRVVADWDGDWYAKMYRAVPTRECSTLLPGVSTLLVYYRYNIELSRVRLDYTDKVQLIYAR